MTCFVPFICFVQLIKVEPTAQKPTTVNKNLLIRIYGTIIVSHLPVKLKGQETNVTFAMTHLTVWERSLICPDLYRGNRFVAHQFLRTPMHSDM